MAENSVRFNGSQPPWWWWKFGGRTNTTVFDNINIGDLPTLICRCSSRLRCYRFLMSNVYIGWTLPIIWIFINKERWTNFTLTNWLSNSPGKCATSEQKDNSTWEENTAVTRLLIDQHSAVLVSKGYERNWLTHELTWLSQATLSCVYSWADILWQHRFSTILHKHTHACIQVHVTYMQFAHRSAAIWRLTDRLWTQQHTRRPASTDRTARAANFRRDLEAT